MITSLPEYNLYADAVAGGGSGRWHFSLESLDGRQKITATDDECEPSGARLELLAVIRGLEALDQPSRVTLMTTSAYVRRGIRFGIQDWRHFDWRWERFGLMVPIAHADLWRRLDQAMQFHEVECRSWHLKRVDQAHVLRGPHRRRHSAKPPCLAKPSQKQAS